MGLAIGQWFSAGTPVSSINTTEILLKVSFYTHIPTLKQLV
jgi:hypothetical protein